MSKEEILKIQTSVLKVHIHCDGCEKKVRKILQKIDGVYKIAIDVDQGKVTVSGNVGPTILIEKLRKNGKVVELWPSPKSNNNNQAQQLVDQLKDLKMDKGGKGGNQQNNIGQGQKGGPGGGNNQMPKGGGGNNVFPPQFNVGQNQKSVKFNMPEDGDDYSDDDDDDFDDAPLNKRKTPVHMGNNGGGGGQIPNLVKDDPQLESILRKHQAMLMNGVNGGGGYGNGQVGGNGGGNSGGNKGGNGGNPNQGGGGGQKNIGNGGGATSMNLHGAQKGGQTSAGHPGMPNMMMPGMNVGGVNKGDQMGQFAPVHGLPAGGEVSMIGGSDGGGGSYFHRPPPEAMANPYHQQEMAGMMMNQQRAARDEMYEPVIAARPPPEVNYMAHYHPYGPYAPPSYGDQYSNNSSEETNPGCYVM